jgi:aminoglycoside phosphotransferase family enzyme/predicted kinase
VEIDALIAALRDPVAFPPPHGARVDVAQTHASAVFLVGDSAWKVKKPVNLGFLDFSTLELRRADCERELRLNRRMVPEIYRGLAAVVRRDGMLRMVRNPTAGDELVEWAVEMRRLPADGMLDRLIPAGGVTAGHFEDFARKLAAFHDAADHGPSVCVHGAVDVLRHRQADCLDRLAAHATHPAACSPAVLPAAFVAALDRRARTWLDRLAPLLEERRAAGRVRDGHGDLQAANTCMLDGRIEAYDCLEFRDEYRCTDRVMDASFLAMDLDRFGRADLAESFLAAYAAASDERGIDELTRFFRMHFAVVRAMTESIRLHQPETPAYQRGTVASKVRAYAQLAAGYAVDPATVLVMGLPATGKSTLAAHLARAMRATVISSDVVRKSMHGLHPTDRAGPVAYSRESTDATYRELARQAAAAVGSVVIDASQRTRAQRAPLVAAATARGSRWVLVDVHADRATIEARMTRRGQDTHRVSDADLAVHDALRPEAEPPKELPQAHRMKQWSSDEHGSVDNAALEVLGGLLGQA